MKIVAQLSNENLRLAVQNFARNQAGGPFEMPELLITREEFDVNVKRFIAECRRALKLVNDDSDREIINNLIGMWR